MTKAQEAQNKAQTKEELQKYLQQTRQDFVNSVKGLSEAQLRFKPAPDRWSVMEVSEHIAFSEDFAGRGTMKMMSAPASDKKAEMHGQEDKLVADITDRSHKFPVPDAFKPTGRWSTQADILNAFNASRDKNLEFVKSTSEADLRSRMGQSPLGELDAHGWMLFMAGHSARHTKQIEEMKADPNFPKS